MTLGQMIKREKTFVYVFISIKRFFIVIEEACEAYAKSFGHRF